MATAPRIIAHTVEPYRSQGWQIDTETGMVLPPPGMLDARGAPLHPKPLPGWSPQLRDSLVRASGYDVPQQAQQGGQRDVMGNLLATPVGTTEGIQPIVKGPYRAIPGGGWSDIATGLDVNYAGGDPNLDPAMVAIAGTREAVFGGRPWQRQQDGTWRHAVTGETQAVPYGMDPNDAGAANQAQGLQEGVAGAQAYNELATPAYQGYQDEAKGFQGEYAGLGGELAGIQNELRNLPAYRDPSNPYRGAEWTRYQSAQLQGMRQQQDDAERDARMAAGSYGQDMGSQQVSPLAGISAANARGRAMVDLGSQQFEGAIQRDERARQELLQSSAARSGLIAQRGDLIGERAGLAGGILSARLGAAQSAKGVHDARGAALIDAGNAQQGAEATRYNRTAAQMGQAVAQGQWGINRQDRLDAAEAAAKQEAERLKQAQEAARNAAIGRIAGGLVKGAVTGAGIGSAAGGVGAIPGAIAGGLVGAFGGAVTPEDTAGVSALGKVGMDGVNHITDGFRRLGVDEAPAGLQAPVTPRPVPVRKAPAVGAPVDGPSPAKPSGPLATPAGRPTMTRQQTQRRGSFKPFGGY